MIQSILDNDLYKFTMQQAVHSLYPQVEVQYQFINRGETSFPAGFGSKIQDEVAKMATLSLSLEQRKFLAESCPFLTPKYLDYLESYRYKPEEVIIAQLGGELSIGITGLWLSAIIWEVPLMAIISELFFSMTAQQTLSVGQRLETNQDKAKILSENGVQFADFGTRRRFSAQNHHQVLLDLVSHDNHTLLGSSNVHFADQFNLKPVGTVAHEWFMFHAVPNGYRLANPAALDCWFKVFNGELGIALTDTYTSDQFLSTFSLDHAQIFDGVRQDSGNPFVFADKIIQHYQRLGIDPATKTVVFSDGLDIEKVLQIHEHCQGRIRDVYGIGTNLTNDVGVAPLNMVIKLDKCRVSVNKPWQNTIKLSDDKGKHTGNPEELTRCKEILQFP